MELRELETEEVRKHLHHQPQFNRKTIAFDLIAGTVAGITSTYAGYPLDLLKFRLQMAPSMGIKQCAHSIY
jgi:hypothetical protein